MENGGRKSEEENHEVLKKFQSRRKRRNSPKSKSGKYEEVQNLLQIKSNPRRSKPSSNQIKSKSKKIKTFFKSNQIKSSPSPKIQVLNKSSPRQIKFSTNLEVQDSSHVVPHLQTFRSLIRGSCNFAVTRRLIFTCIYRKYNL